MRTLFALIQAIREEQEAGEEGEYLKDQGCDDDPVPEDEGCDDDSDCYEEEEDLMKDEELGDETQVEEQVPEKVPEPEPSKLSSGKKRKRRSRSSLKRYRSKASLDSVDLKTPDAKLPRARTDESYVEQTTGQDKKAELEALLRQLAAAKIADEKPLGCRSVACQFAFRSLVALALC